MLPLLNGFSNLSRPAQILSVVGVTGGVGGTAAVAAGGGQHDRIILAAVAVGGLALLVAALLLFGWMRSARIKGKAKNFNDDLAKALGKKFTAGLDVFKANDKGLYDLPWYVLVGEPGAGKTEAIRHSNIGFPSGMNKPNQGSGGTVNMDWWFAKKAVLLDTAGRLMFEANDEWRNFLQLLKEYRPHTPINGMVLAIPVTSLQTDNTDQITDKAGQIANQLDAVQRTLGVRFPVYVLITKVDTIGGFREYFHNLSDPTAQNQMLGWSNPDGLDDPFRPEAVEEHLLTVAERLRRRRLGLLLDPATVNEGSSRRLDQVDALYAFPNELSRISSRLKLYLETIFTPGEWSMAPLFLRGIYFTSAVSQGAALDIDLASSLGLSATEAAVPVFESKKSYFLKDVFLDKCFPEGGLVTGEKNVSSAMRRRQIGLATAGLAASLAMVAGSAYAYLNMRNSVGKHADFWHPVANIEADRLRLFDAGGHYRGTEPAAGGYTVAALHATAADLSTNHLSVPVLFTPWDRMAGGSGLDAECAEAHRRLYGQYVYVPLLNAAANHLKDGSADPVAVHDLVLLSAGGPSARQVDDAGRLYRTAGLDAQQMTDAGPTSLARPIALFGTAWPPNANVNVTTVAEDAAKFLGQRSVELTRQFDDLSHAITAVTDYRRSEDQLLALADGPAATDRSDQFALSWRQREDALRTNSIVMREALLTAGVVQAPGMGPLSARYQALSRQRTDVLEPFNKMSEGMPAEARLVVDRARDQAGELVRDKMDAVATAARSYGQTDGSTDVAEILAHLDGEALTYDAWQTRLTAYTTVRTALLATPAEPPSAAWVGVQPPAAVEAPLTRLGSGAIDARAAALQATAVRYANAKQIDLWTTTVTAHLPRSVDDWVALAASESIQAGQAQSPTAIPLSDTTPPTTDAAEFRPLAAVKMTRDWAAFRKAWGPTITNPGMEGLSAEHFKETKDGFIKANTTFAGYVGRYVKYWQGILPTTAGVKPMGWADGPDSVVATLGNAQFQTSADNAIGSWLSVPDTALGALSSRLANVDQTEQLSSSITDAASSLDPNPDLGAAVFNRWLKIIGPPGPGGSVNVGRAGDAIRRLSDAQYRELFGPASPASLRSAYWQAFSARCLSALRVACKDENDRLSREFIDKVNRLPLSVSDAAMTNPITPNELRSLSNAASNVELASARFAPVPSSLPAGVRDDLEAIRNLADVHGPDPATVKRIDRLVSAAETKVSIYVLDSAQQINLAGNATPGPDDLAKLFDHVQMDLCSKVNGQWVDDDPGRSWPVASVNGQQDLRDARFDASDKLVRLHFTSASGVTEDVDMDDLWWPTRLLRDGQPQPVNELVNQRYVCIPVKHAGRTYPFWVKLEFEGGAHGVDPADLLPPATNPATAGQAPVIP